MSVLPSDIVVYGSANMPEADGAINGGPVDFSRRVAFYDIAPAGNLDVISSSASDTATKITFYGRDATGVVQNQILTNRWSFPAVGTYAASQSDIGNALSSYNTPVSSLTVTLPPTSGISAGWTMGFATDNGKTMTVQVNGASGGHILYPAGATGSAGDSVTLAPVNYEFMVLQFDGSNFRIVSITPRSASALGMLGHQIMTGATPALGSGSSDCGTSPSIGGNDSAGRVTVGAANGGRCTITFASAWPNPPVCSAFDETTATLVRPTAASTASIVLTGAFTAGDVLAYSCVGFQ